MASPASPAAARAAAAATGSSCSGGYAGSTAGSTASGLGGGSASGVKSPSSSKRSGGDGSVISVARRVAHAGAPPAVLAPGAMDRRLDPEVIRRALMGIPSLNDPTSPVSTQFWQGVSTHATTPGLVRLDCVPLSSRTAEELFQALKLARQLIPDSHIDGFIAFGQGLGPSVPDIEQFVTVEVVHAPLGPVSVCFLCAGAASKSNPVNVGEVSLSKSAWGPEGGRAAYKRRYASFHCPDGVKKHGCRRVLIEMANSVGCSCPDRLDDMARCYPVDILESYLAEDAPVRYTHKRCRGGLLSMLKYLLVIEQTAGPVKRVKTGTPCTTCGIVFLSPPDLQLFTATREDAIKCIGDFQRIIPSVPCPVVYDLHASVSHVHFGCRQHFRRRFLMKDAEVHPSLHCCWDLGKVLDLFNLTLDGRVGSECEMAVCPSCLDSLHHLFRTIVAFYKRVEAERAMSQYIRGVAWTSVSERKQHLMRSVLYRPPFRIRTPDALDDQVYVVVEQILGCIDVELRRHGEEPLTEEDKLPFRRFAESKRIEAVDTPSGVISEASAFSLTSISQALPPLGMSRR